MAGKNAKAAWENAALAFFMAKGNFLSYSCNENVRKGTYKQRRKQEHGRYGKNL